MDSYIPLSQLGVEGALSIKWPLSEQCSSCPTANNQSSHCPSGESVVQLSIS